MLRPILLALALVGCLADILHAQVAVNPPGQKLDLSFVPEDAVAAVVIHPQQILTSPQAVWWPTEVLTVAAKKEAGFDPMQIERIMVIIGMPQPGGPPSFGAILRFQKPVDADAMAAKIVTQGADEKIEGRRARIAISQFEPSIAFADDRTVLIANGQSLTWLLTAKQNNSPLQKLLLSVNETPTAAAYAVLEPLRPMIAQMMPMIQDNIPPMLRDLFDLPMTVDNLQIAADMREELAGGMNLQIRFGTADAETANGVASVLKRGMRDVKAMMISQMSVEFERDPENQELSDAMMRYMQRIGDMIIAQLEPKVDGNDAVIKTELRTGVAEVGVMTALLLPAVQAAREAARRSQSQNNLKQIALAFHNYHDMKKTFPANANYDANGKPLLSWRVHILPFIEEGHLYQQFHLDEPWDSEHNKKLIEKMPIVYKHPNFNKPTETVYQAIVGKGAAFEGKEGLRIQTFTDGTSNTIMVAEVAPEKAVPWTKPEDWEFDPGKQIEMNDFGGLMAGDLFNVVFADGSVQAFSRSIDPDQLKLFFTRNGGEPVRR